MEKSFGYHAIKEQLIQRLQEDAPGRLQLLTGPLQVGKTTMLLEIASLWGDGAFCRCADAPEAALPGWWERLWHTVRAAALKRTTVLLLDEIHYMPQWARLVKSAIDEAHRDKLSLHIVATGSAALTITAGNLETMAGRFERLVLRQWTPRDIAQAFALGQEESLDCYVRYGSFPGSMCLLKDLPRWRSYMRDSIIDSAVGRDLLMLQPVRKPALLRQIFSMCIGHPSEIFSLAKIAGALTDAGALETIAQYLGLLEEVYLVSPVRKYSSREMRKRRSPPKLVALFQLSLKVMSPLP